MERRGFLKGIIGGLTSAGLIVAAKPEEIAAFASPMAREAPIVVAPEPVVPVSMGMELYNKQGDVVAYVTEIQASPTLIDVTTFHDTSKQYMDAFRDVELRAVLLPHVTVTMSQDNTDLFPRYELTPPKRRGRR